MTHAYTGPRTPDTGFIMSLPIKVFSFALLLVPGLPAHAGIDGNITHLAQMAGDSNKMRGMGVRGREMKGGPHRDDTAQPPAAENGEAEVEGKKMPPPEDVIISKDNSVSRQYQVERGLIDSGLVPRYPAEADCPPVASPFASPTRFDGSQRTYRANYGLHSGLDISLPVGTPLLAIADGTLIHKFRGGTLTGNQVFLRHEPADTGYPLWIYTMYKHFDQMPEIAIGSRVRKGQAIGPAGRTGTQDRYFGNAGYPHLHMTIYVSDVPDYFENRIAVYPRGGRIIDPLAVFGGKALDNHKLRNLPDAERVVDIPYQTPDGKQHPASARFVWPVACVPR